METKLKSTVELAYVIGGISQKSGKPYLQLSDGVEAKFVTLSPELQITTDTFASLERGDTLKVVIEREALADRNPVVVDILG